MPKAKTGNFTLKTIVKGCPADKAAHRFLALQRSGGYSELRMIQRGKAKIDIVGYKWPDKGVRRKLGIGRARVNPGDPDNIQFFCWECLQPRDRAWMVFNAAAFGIPLEIYSRKSKSDHPIWNFNVDNVQRLAKLFEGKTDTDIDRMYSGEFLTWYAGVKSHLVRQPNPGTPSEIATTIWRQISVGVKMSVGAHKATALAKRDDYVAGLQFKLGGRREEWIQIWLTGQDLYDIELVKVTGRPKRTIVAKKVSGAYAEDLDLIVAEMFLKGRSLKSPDENPNQKGQTTPNQVLFGSNGRTKVGWINRETKTRYEITYKDGARTRTVWRDKNKVKFQRTGKVKRIPNNCPKKANPQDVDIVAASEMFHQRAPRFEPFKEDFEWPTKMPLIGPCTQIEYVSDKFDGKVRRYYHKFGKGTRVYFDPSHQKNGESILVIRGPFEIKPEGITG